LQHGYLERLGSRISRVARQAAASSKSIGYYNLTLDESFERDSTEILERIQWSQAKVVDLNKKNQKTIKRAAAIKAFM
jgi:hypothetical protein